MSETNFAIDDIAVTAIAVRTVQEIIKDLTSRSGLGNTWEEIDSETQSEIKEVWRKFVRNEIFKVLNQNEQ